MKNNYGNYVVQKALKVAKGYLKFKLIILILKNIDKIGDKKLIIKWNSIIGEHLPPEMKLCFEINNLNFNDDLNNYNTSNIVRGNNKLKFGNNAKFNNNNFTKYSNYKKERNRNLNSNYNFPFTQPNLQMGNQNFHNLNLFEQNQNNFSLNINRPFESNPFPSRMNNSFQNYPYSPIPPFTTNLNYPNSSSQNVNASQNIQNYPNFPFNNSSNYPINNFNNNFNNKNAFYFDKRKK